MLMSLTNQGPRRAERLGTCSLRLPQWQTLRNCGWPATIVSMQGIALRYS